MSDRFRNYTTEERAAAIKTLTEMITHPGVIPPLLKGEVESLIEMLPNDFFVVSERFQLRQLASRRKTQVLSELSTSAAKKLAEKSVPLTDQHQKDLSFLCYVNPALWFRTVAEMKRVSTTDAESVVGDPKSAFRGGSANKRKR